MQWRTPARHSDLYGRSDVRGFELISVVNTGPLGSSRGSSSRHDVAFFPSTVGLADPNMAAAVKEKNEGGGGLGSERGPDSV